MKQAQQKHGETLCEMESQHTVSLQTAEAQRDEIQRSVEEYTNMVNQLKIQVGLGKASSRIWCTYGIWGFYQIIYKMNKN